VNPKAYETFSDRHVRIGQIVLIGKGQPAKSGLSPVSPGGTAFFHHQWFDSTP
jgi:hypothetical protein